MAGGVGNAKEEGERRPDGERADHRHFVDVPELAQRDGDRQREIAQQRVVVKGLVRRRQRRLGAEQDLERRLPIFLGQQSAERFGDAIGLGDSRGAARPEALGLQAREEGDAGGIEGHERLMVPAPAAR